MCAAAVLLFSKTPFVVDIRSSHLQSSTTLTRVAISILVYDPDWDAILKKCKRQC